MDRKANPAYRLTNVTPGYKQRLRQPVLPGSKIDLEDILEKQFLGKTVFLFFHRGATDPKSQVMIDNLGRLATSSLLKEETEIIAISTEKITIQDDFIVHSAEDKNKNEASILAVEDPNGSISKRFGVLDLEKHKCLMSLFILGPDGVVKGVRVWGEGLEPNLEELKTIVSQ